MGTQLLHMTAPPLSSPDTLAMASSEPGLTLELSLGGSFSTIEPSHQGQHQELLPKQAIEELCDNKLPEQGCYGVACSSSSSSSSQETCSVPASSQSRNIMSSFPFVNENASANTGQGQEDSAFDIIKRQIQAKRRQEARKRRKSLIEEKQHKKCRRDEFGASFSFHQRSPLMNTAPSEDSEQLLLENPKKKSYKNLVNGVNSTDSIMESPFLKILVSSRSNHGGSGSGVAASCVSSSYMNMASDEKPSYHSSSSEHVEDEEICTDEQSSVQVLKNNNGGNASGCMYDHGEGQSQSHSQGQDQQPQQLQHVSMMMTSGPMHFSMAPYPYPMTLPWGFSLPCYMQYPHAAAAAAATMSNAFGSAFPYQLPMSHQESRAFSPWVPVVPMAAAATVPCQPAEDPSKQSQEESGQDEDVGATRSIHQSPAQDKPSVLSMSASESLTEEKKKVSLVISSIPGEQGMMEKKIEFDQQPRHKSADAVLELDSKGIDAVLKLESATAKIGADAVLKLDTKGTLKLGSKAADAFLKLDTNCNDAVLKLDSKGSDTVLKMDTKGNDVMFKLDQKGFDVFHDAATIASLDSRTSDAIDAAISKGSDTLLRSNTAGKPALCRLIESNGQDLNEDDKQQENINSEGYTRAWTQQERLSSDLNLNSTSAVKDWKPAKKVKVVRFNCCGDDVRNKVVKFNFGDNVQDDRLPHLACNESGHAEEEERKKPIPAYNNAKTSTTKEEMSSAVATKVSQKSSSSSLPIQSPAHIKSINGVVGPKSIAKLPRVSTTGTGPNGKTVYGIMYITEDKQARLICICHGKHMSALEFVQHSESSDISNPERRIKINYIPSDNNV